MSITEPSTLTGPASAEAEPSARIERCLPRPQHLADRPELIDQTIWEVFEAERPKLVPYAGRFDIAAGRFRATSGREPMQQQGTEALRRHVRAGSVARRSRAA